MNIFRAGYALRENRPIFQQGAEQPHTEAADVKEGFQAPQTPEQADISREVAAAKNKILILNPDDPAQAVSKGLQITEQGSEALQTQLARKVAVQQTITGTERPTGLGVDPELTAATEATTTLGVQEEKEETHIEESPPTSFALPGKFGPIARAAVVAAVGQAPPETPPATTENILRLRSTVTERAAALSEKAGNEVGEDMNANKTLLSELKTGVENLNKWIKNNPSAMDADTNAKTQEAMTNATEKIKVLEEKFKEQSSKKEGEENADTEKKEPPKTHGEKLERDMEEAMKKGEKNPLAYLKGIGALFQYIQRSFRGTLDDPFAPSGTASGAPGASGEGPSPEQLKQKEAESKTKKEIQEKGYDTVRQETTNTINNLTTKLMNLRMEERDLRSEEGREKTNVEALQRRINQDPPPANKKELEEMHLQHEAALKTLQAKIEGIQKQTASLEKEDIASNKKLKDMKKLSEQATKTKETIMKGIGQTKFVLEGLKAQNGMADVAEIATLLGNLDATVDVSKVDIKLEMSGGGVGAEKLRDTAQKLLGKTPGYEELGIDANGNITNTEKFMGILLEFQQKLEKKSGEETSKRERAKQQGKEYLSEKNAQESSTGSFKITSGTHEAAFTFNIATGAWQWSRNGILVDVPRDPFGGGSAEETYLNDIARDLQRKTA